MHGHLPLVPLELPDQREVEVGAADDVLVCNSARAPVFLEQCRELQHLFGVHEPRAPLFRAVGLHCRLDALDSPVEVGEDRVLGELEVAVIWDGELGAAFVLKGLPGNGVRKEVVGMVVNCGYEGADGLEA